MNKPMTGSEIARELDITRQAVSQTLKSGIRKMYNEVLRTKIADTPFDAICALMYGFNLHEASQEEVVDFLFLLPNDIRREVEKDARCRF
jgi:DNA-binding transcriptional regulator LsrR (DeoR family)